MRHENYEKQLGCPIEAALEVIGGKWKGVILYYLKDGAKRFHELKQSMPTVTEMTLSLQLKQLVICHIVKLVKNY